MPTIILGLGNPLLGDDGVGWRAAEAVQAKLARVPGNSLIEMPEIDCLAVGGLGLMERLTGYTRAILIDSLNTGSSPPGAVTTCSLEDLPNRAAGHLASAHDTTLQNALRVGQQMGAQLPDEIRVVAIETESNYIFSETLSPSIAAAIPVVVEEVLALLRS